MTQIVSHDDDTRSVLIGTGMLFVGAIMISFAAIGLRLAVQDGVGPQTTALWRFLFAIPMLGAIFLVMRRLPKPPHIFPILAGLFFGLDIGFWHLSLTMTSVANSTFIVNIGSICVGFLAWMVLRERPTLFWAAGVVFAIFGAFMLSRGGQSAEGSGGLAGDLMAGIAACFVAFYFLFARMARRHLPALDSIFWATCMMASVSAGYCLVFGEPFVPETTTQFRWPFMIALLSHVCGQGLIFMGLGRAPASVAGIMVVMQPVAAAFVSWPLFGEELSELQLAGAGLIVFALLLSQLKASVLKSWVQRPKEVSH